MHIRRSVRFLFSLRALYHLVALVVEEEREDAYEYSDHQEEAQRNKARRFPQLHVLLRFIRSDECSVVDLVQ